MRIFSLCAGDPAGVSRAWRVTSSSSDNDAESLTTCDSADKKSKIQSKSTKNSPVLFSGTHHLFQLRNKILMNFGHGGFSNIIGKPGKRLAGRKLFFNYSIVEVTPRGYLPLVGKSDFVE